MISEQILTARLCLEPLSEKHLSEKYVNWLNDRNTNKYLETRGGYDLKTLESFIWEHKHKKTLFWAIIFKETGEHIGNIKIDPIDSISKTGEYGILMGDKRFWGKGLAKEASFAVIDFCFNKLNLEKITLGVIEDNVNAVNLYQKMGFIITSRKIKYGVYNNKSCDLLRMAYKRNNQKLILGTVQMGLPYGISNTEGKVSLEESHGILRTAYLNGIRTLDSAELYGNAHEVIGCFHRENPGMKFQVITKLPHEINDKIQFKLKTYLHDLAVDQLDALLFHSFATYHGHAATLQELQSNQLAKSIGVSIYTNEELEIVMNDSLVDIIQLPFNLLDNYALRGEWLEKAKDLGKTIHTRSAYLQGLFFQSIDSDKKIVQSLKAKLIRIKEIAAAAQLTVQELALAYCLQQENIDNVLIGVDSDAQLVANINSCELKLSESILDELNAIHVKDVNLLNPSLWSKL